MFDGCQDCLFTVYATLALTEFKKVRKEEDLSV